MKARPILFSAPMVRAILEGRKTQTRRLVNMRDVGMIGPRGSDDEPESWGFEDGNTGIWWTIARGHTYASPMGIQSLPCPYGERGDRLWVRETFAIECNVEDNPPPHNDGRPLRRYNYADGDDRWEQPHYRATDPDPELCIENSLGEEECGVRWKPSIHMPRWASRITLCVTSVRVDRLQAISEEDARAEGVEPNPGQDWWACFCEADHRSFDMTVEPSESYRRKHGITHVRHTPAVEKPARDVFELLWDGINGKQAPWSENPWVWVVSFEVVT